MHKCIWSYKMTDGYSLHLLQYVPLKPSWHPFIHTPLTWSHGSLLIQCPLQLSLQSTPKCPPVHSMRKRLNSVLYKCLKTQLKLVNVCIYELVIGLNNQVKYVYTKLSVNLPLLQSPSVYPGLHPWPQWPVSLLHVDLLRQWPLQLLTQLNP